MTYIIDTAFAILAYFNHTKTQTANSATVAFDFVASALAVSLLSLSSVWVSVGSAFFIAYATKEAVICSFLDRTGVKWAYCVSAVVHIAVCVDVEFVGSMVMYNNYSGTMLMVCFAKIVSACEVLNQDRVFNGGVWRGQ